MLSILAHRIDLEKVFQGAPIIYLILLALSIASFGIWMFTYLTSRLPKVMPHVLASSLFQLLREEEYSEAIALCQHDKSPLARIIYEVLAVKGQGHDAMTEMMRIEGKRFTLPLWQRISLIHEISVIAPMLGLLGTVLGMFYAFYDTKSSTQTLMTLFDGLGVSVGTTVAGLMVALLSTALYLTAKYRLTRLADRLEQQCLLYIRHIQQQNPLKELLTRV